MLLAINLKSQTSVVCSSGLVSFEEYQPILYPELGRRAALSDKFDFELSIMPGGKFDYKPIGPIPDYHGSADLFQEAIISAFSGWRFVNDTNELIVLKLNVIFELSGVVRSQDNIAKNSIIIDQNSVTIKVIATKILPRLAM